MVEGVTMRKVGCQEGTEIGGKRGLESECKDEEHQAEWQEEKRKEKQRKEMSISTVGEEGERGTPGGSQ